MTKEERDEMMHRNWVAQMNGLGFDESGYMLDTPHPIRLVEEPKWISVKERLPKEKEHVLIWIKGLCIIIDWIVNGKWVVSDEIVTHWMPLPEPPIEGDNE